MGPAAKFVFCCRWEKQTEDKSSVGLRFAALNDRFNAYSPLCQELDRSQGFLHLQGNVRFGRLGFSRNGRGTLHVFDSIIRGFLSVTHASKADLKRN